MSYIYNLADTWNAGATTFTAVKMNVTDTASAAGSLLMDLQVGGVSQFKVDKTGIMTAASALAGTTGWFQNSVTIGSLTGGDVILTRDAANTLAQRNGVNAQVFRLYNTYTDASNYERGGWGWSANELILGTGNAGTGSPRSLVLQVGAAEIRFQTAFADRWKINASGHFLAGADNTYDIGASGATRPRALYVASSVYAPYLNTTSGAGAVRAFWYSVVADVMSLGKAAGSLGGSLELTEDTAPAAPSTNSVRIYAEDNGAGKTRIMARFATGAAVQIAIEP